MNEDKFLDFVISEAEKIGHVFVLDTGKGRDMPNPPDGMDVEDLFCWLLTSKQAETIPHRTRGERDELFERDDIPLFVARWDTDADGQLIIRFEEVQEMV